NQSWPSISKSAGASPYALQRYTIVYQQTFSATDEDIYGSMLTWDGTFVQVGGSNTFLVNGSIFSHHYPQASPPTIVDSHGHRQIAAVFESPSSNAGDIIINTFDETGSVIGGANVSMVENDPNRLAWPQHRPCVDTDGLRFAVGYDENYNSGADLDTRATLLSPLGSGFLVTEPAATLAFSGAPEFNMQMASVYATSGSFDRLFGTA